MTQRFTAKQKADGAAREVRHRRRVYAHLVENGRMTQAKADYEIALMEEIREDYNAKTAAESPRLPLEG